MARSSAQPVDHQSRQECLHYAGCVRAVGTGKEVDVRLCCGGQPEISLDSRATQNGADAGIKNRAQAGVDFAGRFATGGEPPVQEARRQFQSGIHTDVARL